MSTITTTTLSRLTSEQLRSLHSSLTSSPDVKMVQQVESILQPAWLKNLVLTPTARQQEFLNLTSEEALYGGAAGGGKSEALLMWLAEGINIPGYTGLIFRRTYPQLSKSNDGLIAKASRLYRPLGGTWNGSDKQWRFPSGAMIEMGHLPYEKSTEDYTGPSYHRIAFDELTQFTESQYTFLIGRIRRTVGFPISLGVRAATNPGGEGHIWVKNRFVTKAAMDFLKLVPLDQLTPPGSVFWSTSDRAFVPSRLIDNPFIDREDYERKLSHLPPVTRARMKAGDWSINEEGVFRADWLLYWEPQGDYYRLFSRADKLLKVVHPNECVRFVTIDAAGTSKQKAAEKKGKPPNHSCISTWDFHPSLGLLLWRDMRRGRWGFPELCANTFEVFQEHNPDWIGAEDASNGRPLLDTLTSLPMKALDHGGKDKLSRAARWLNEAHEGRFFMPRFASWRDDAESEILAWTGHPDEQDDIIDTCSYAELYCRSSPGGTIEIENLIFAGR